MGHDVTKETKYMSDDQNTIKELILQEKALAFDYLHFIQKFDGENKDCYNGVQISIDQWNQKNSGEIKWKVRYTSIREAGVKVFIGGYEMEEIHRLVRNKDGSVVASGAEEELYDYIRNELNGMSETEWNQEYTWDTEVFDKYEIWVNELGLDAICFPS